jgi:hypothetical protein
MYLLHIKNYDLAKDLLRARAHTHTHSTTYGCSRPVGTLTDELRFDFMCIAPVYAAFDSSRNKHVALLQE